MGQEASLPQHPENGESLEEQAKAPPSSTNPAPPTTGRSNRKLMGAMMFRTQQQQQQPTQDNYEQREAARAVATGGNLYLRDDSNSDHDVQQQQQANGPQSTGNYPTTNLLMQEQMNGALAHQEDHIFEQLHRQQQQQQQQQAYYQQNQQTQQHPAAAAEPPVVGIMYEKTSPRKGLLYGKVTSGRGAALLNSMRNLSLGGTLRPKQAKEAVTDWEKQWDEDEDDSEGEGDNDEKISVPLHHEAKSLQAQQLASPSLSVPPSPHLISSADSTAPADLLSGSVAVGPSSIMQQQQHLHVVEDDRMEWDTAARKAEQEGKPNVRMFMPMLRVLGKGSFGKVVLVQKRVGKERGQLFAMKILRKTHLVKRRQIERTRTERKVLSLVNHPFIMKLHYAFQSEEKLYLVLDYCPGGELFFHLSRFRRFPERVARFYSAELLLAIGHLHKRGIIYRDLKPENVLLDADGHVKLGDFGLAKAGITNPLEGAMSMCGTPEYMAPEVLAQQGHGFCVDYWGLGMITYEMMTGLPPWYTTDRTKLFRKLKSAPLDIPSYFSVHSANCVSALLERDPRRRLGVTGVRTAMEHEFFRNISWRALYARRVEPPIRPCEGWKPPEAIKDDTGELADPYSVDYSDVEEINSKDLEVAVRNFDDQFTRLPVESEDATHESSADDLVYSELNEHTFRGFSFDCKDRESSGSLSSPAASIAAAPVRQRSHPYPAQSHTLD